MNIIGKIFLFAVFVMSLMLMTFAGVIYVTHEQFKDDIYRKPEDCLPGQARGYVFQIEDAEKERARLEAQITQLQQKVAESEQARDQVIAKLQSAVVQKDTELRDLRDKRAQLEQSQQESVALLEKATEDLRTAREMVGNLQQQMATQQAKVDTEVGRAAELSAKLAETRAFLEIAEERKAQLERQVANARLLLQQHNLDVDSLTSDRVPTLDGEVLTVSGDLIEVSLGGDDGLQKSHTLHVYRGGTYVGRAVVTSVQPDRAVARLIKDYARDAVQRGDRVTTRLKA